MESFPFYIFECISDEPEVNRKKSMFLWRSSNQTDEPDHQTKTPSVNLGHSIDTHNGKQKKDNSEGCLRTYTRTRKAIELKVEVLPSAKDLAPLPE
ncbi:hypothetical protein RhiTH_001652 [Rhizoctonia solani]